MLWRDVAVEHEGAEEKFCGYNPQNLLIFTESAGEDSQPLPL